MITYFSVEVKLGDAQGDAACVHYLPEHLISV